MTHITDLNKSLRLKANQKSIFAYARRREFASLKCQNQASGQPMRLKYMRQMKKMPLKWEASLFCEQSLARLMRIPRPRQFEIAKQFEIGQDLEDQSLKCKRAAVT